MFFMNHNTLVFKAHFTIVKKPEKDTRILLSTLWGGGRNQM